MRRNPLSPTQDLSFCITEWNVENINKKMEVNGKEVSESVFLIKIYGCSKEGTSICLNVEGFRPYFFIEIPKTWTKVQSKDYLRNVFTQIQHDKKTRYFPKRIFDEIDRISVLSRKKFYGFTNNELFKFIKLSFKNTYDFDLIKRKIGEVEFKPFEITLFLMNICLKPIFHHFLDLFTKEILHLLVGLK